MTTATTDQYRIRKYPNRRLYDTRRSKFITSEELYSIVRSGNRIHVTDSASGSDITNIVLLNTVIDRDPARILAIPSDVFHAMVAGGNEGGSPVSRVSTSTA
jgi:polyhydroxyalkanoate synthesis repressor PhaR